MSLKNSAYPIHITIIEMFVSEANDMDSHYNYITKIKINNVRHLKNIEIPLSETECKHLIITGKNGSGKTSLLEALRLFLLFHTADNQYVSWLYNILSDEPLKNQFKLNDETLKELSKEKFWISMQDDEKKINHITGVEIHFKNLAELKEKNIQDKFVIAYYPAERTYSVPNEKTDKIKFKNSYALYEHPGKDFVKYLKELVSQEALFRVKGNIIRADKIKTWLDNLKNILRTIYANNELKVNFDIEQMKFFIEEPGKIPFSFDELASGYAAILDIITDLMMRMEKTAGSKYDMPGFVLIDEVDAHLHISLQKNILPTLTTLFPKIQFIVTTHSPFVLNSIDNVVVYDLETKTLVNTAEGLSLLPYSGIVEGYFGVSELSKKLKEKFERYKELAKKPNFTDDDYNELSDLESYLDEIPDFLALDIMADYRQIKLELENR